MSTESHERIIILNRMVSDSVTRAPQEHKPPIHGADEIFSILRKRVDDKYCLEFFDVVGDSDSDVDRIKMNQGKNCIRVAKMELSSSESWNYATFLLNYIDNSVRSFPVVDIVNYEGRDLAGGENERGSFSAHMVVRYPNGDNYDDGSYRCTIESVSNITRRTIEILIDRQLRRYASVLDWKFSVETSKKSKNDKVKEYKYYPKVGLFADVGRSLQGLSKGGKTLSHFVFTNRSEKQAIAQATAVSHEDLYASVEIKISAKQAPDDVEQKKQWLSSVKSYFEKRGYDTKMYFRHIKGEISGSVHPSLAGATDLLLCPRESIYTTVEPQKWFDEIQPEIRDEMKKLLDRDDLWERAK